MAIKIKFLLLMIFVISFCSQSCNKVEAEPSIVFKNADAAIVTGDTIMVELTDVKVLLVEIKYDGTAPKYLRQINNGFELNMTDSTDVDVITHGLSDINFENSEITTKISELDTNSGSVIKTSVRLGTDLSKSVYYKIK